MCRSDPQRLRDLADTLDSCEWEHPLGSAQLCRDAAAELEQNRAAALEALAVPPGNENTHYGRMARDNPVSLLAASYALARTSLPCTADGVPVGPGTESRCERSHAANGG